VQATFANEGRRQELDVLLRLLLEIVSETERQIGGKVSGPAKLQMSTVIGVVFFADRLLIHQGVLREFLGWDFFHFDQVMRSEDFRGQSLCWRQFGSLQNQLGLQGNKFEWRIHRYPRVLESQELVHRVQATGGESFYLAASGAQNPTIRPRLSRSMMDGLTIPPENIPRLRFSGLSMSQVLGMYADDRPSGKCWLLYAEDDV
jgi:hypothetical protein